MLAFREQELFAHTPDEELQAIAHVLSNEDYEYYDNPADGAESIVGLYAGELLNPSAIKAIKLFELAAIAQEPLDSPSRDRATWAIVDYLTGPDCRITSEEMDYIASLLGDIPLIENAANNYQLRLRHETGDGDILDVLDENNILPIPPEYWDELRFGIDLPELTKLAKKANVESIIVMAARTLNKITHPSGNDKAQLKAIIEAETFYAPLLDALGLSAFEMAMRSEANKARMVASGHEELVEKSRENLAVANEIGLDPVIRKIFGKTDESPEFQVNACVPSGEIICFNESSLDDLTDNQHNGRLIGRIKTIGSLADKMLHNPDYENALPQDVVGFTAVLEDTNEVADFFKYVYGHLKEREKSGEIKLVNAPSKTQPISAQGTPEFIADLHEALGEEFTEPIHEKKFKDKKPENTFQVIKITFDIEVDGKVLPVEFQFMTRQDRYNARLGGASHIHFKSQDEQGLLGNIPGDEGDLDTINRRKADLYSDPSNTTPINEESADRFRQTLLRVVS